MGHLYPQSVGAQVLLPAQCKHTTPDDGGGGDGGGGGGGGDDDDDDDDDDHVTRETGQL